MAKNTYELTCKAKHVEIKDGIAIITFERNDAEIPINAEDSGEIQSNALWENFTHSFRSFDDEGNEIMFDYHTGEVI